MRSRSLSTLVARTGPFLAASALALTGVVAAGPPVGSPRPAATSPVALEQQQERLAGQDRYETAARVSRYGFPQAPVPVVHVVTGQRPADALAAGPAAARLGGPVLPVTRDAVPGAVAAELERLRPGRIVVLGGTAAVGRAVERDLAAYTQGTVTRVAGADRYQTAAAVARSAFDGPVARVLVATGEGFADALAAGAVGAGTDSPLLLVRPDGVPAATADALRRLQPAGITALGGTAALGDAVLRELQPLTGGRVDRVAGADRAGTAARLAEVFWPDGAATVYLATGSDFPDALAAGPAAGGDDAPLLLARQSCLPAATVTQLDRLAAQTVVVLGGQGAVSDAALTRTCTEGVQDLLLDEAAAERAEAGDFQPGAPFTRPLLDPCAGGTAYPRDADRTATAAVSLRTLREAGGTTVRQTIARYTSPAVAADAAAGYERAVRGCPGGSDDPQSFATAYEVVRSDQDAGTATVVVRVSQGAIYASYVAVQQQGDLVSVLSVGYGEDGDPGVQAIEPYLPEVTAALRRG